MMGTAPRERSSDTTHIWVSRPQRLSNCYSDPEGRFTIVAAGDADIQAFLRLDAYSAAKAFVEGKFAVRGDIFAAIRFFLNQRHSTIRGLLFSLVARLEHLRTYSLLGRRRQAAESIQFHYDRSNEFYAQFLDSRMVYSEAHFTHPDMSLEQAQAEKLDRICRHLELKRGDRFLDIGCGWGGLVAWAAEHYSVTAFGCTLSNQQLEFAREVVRRLGLADQVSIEAIDYRDLNGSFDKIASVGMFEHVGHSRLPGYFNKIYSLLNRNGLFINRGVVRPQGISDDPETLFLRKNVFPGSQLVHLDDVVRQGERAGLEVIRTEDLHKQYALTCRAWGKNLQERKESCCSLVGEKTYRTWLLYLAASAVGFEDARTSASEVLFVKN
jgi:cyclopropane-fatty-acyl-phospholipid synthase